MQEHKKITVEINFGTIVKTILFILLLVALFLIRNVVMIVLMSVIIASALEMIFNWFEKRRVPRTIAVIFVYLCAFSILGFIVYLVVPTFINEIATFANEIPAYFENNSNWQTLFGLVPNVPVFFSSSMAEFFRTLHTQAIAFTGNVFNTASSVFGGAFSVVLIVVLSFYLSVQKHGVENFLKIVTPARYESYLIDLWRRTQKKLGLWLQGQILLGLLMGIFVYLGLTILGIKYALVFALLTAAFEIIPIFGPILSAIPPVMLGFLESPKLGIAVIILYIVLQQFENHLIYPIVVRKIVGVPPILSILAIIIGGELGGFLGILLAVPMAAALQEFLTDVVTRKQVST